MADAPSLARNPTTVVGAWLTTIAAFAFIAWYAVESFGLIDNPYSGLIGFVTLPALFIFGLLLVPLGMWREARRRRRGVQPWAWPSVNLGHSRTRAVVLAVGVLTLVNLSLVTVATMGAVHYMETNEFCGQVCHTPMKPEFTAHRVATHASVACVQCHVGPGAAGTIQAKMNGARQAYLFLKGTFQRPIPTPVHKMPTPAETCVRCHSMDLPARDVSYVTHEYSDDEENTDTATAVVMFTKAAHWHARPDIVVEYSATDDTRETIPYVKVTEAGGTVTEYQSTANPTRPAGPLRRMDCLDCHNRPAHTMSASAEQAVDKAITAGRIARSLPFVRREAVAALKADYPGEDAAVAAIRQRLTEFYRPRPAVPGADVQRAIESVSMLYRTNVFPDMKVTWGTYKSQMVHPEGTGCLRCHDDEHKAVSGKFIRQDCEICHKVD